MAKVLTGNEFENMDKSGVILLDFFADWCGPCQMLAPVLDELSNELTDVQIIKVNVEDATGKVLAMKNKVMSIPTMLVMVDGEVKNRTNGFIPKEEIISFINENK